MKLDDLFIVKRKLCKDGYVFAKLNSGFWVKEHRFVMAKKIGRWLKPREIVHHINEKRSDNRIENLEIVTDSTHTTLHSSGKKMVEIKCLGCGLIFVREKRQTHLQKKRNKYTVCSNFCSGKISKLVSVGSISKDDINKSVLQEFSFWTPF